VEDTSTALAITAAFALESATKEGVAVVEPTQMRLLGSLDRLDPNGS
jgi:hypothetical protein